MSVLDMRLNHLMVKLQPWIFGECGVPLHCNCSQVHADPIDPRFISVAPDRVLSMDQIEQTVCKQMNDVKLWLLHFNTLNHLTVCKKKKRAQVCLRMLSTKCVYKSYVYLIYMYKENLSLNNLQWLICHKTQPYQTNLAFHFYW